MTDGLHIHVSGIVQGVGFRPFVYNLALEYGCTGWVRNTSTGVDIELDGQRADLEQFLQYLRAETPTLAQIDDIVTVWKTPAGYKTFDILQSTTESVEFLPISPDISICSDCFRELFDPQNRRYRYPFINCTNCGPRFTIIRDIPYDRPNTTMAGFEMCSECASEYQNPSDRRFHAQPVACATCGPQVWLERGSDGDLIGRRDEALRQAREMIRDGAILAIKGLGGFHLACDATNHSAVLELRRRKLRVDKPFALMLADPEAIAAHCLVSPVERELIQQHERSVVIVRRRPDSPISDQVAPGQNTLGVMLPYTPLHYLLFANPDDTSLVFDLPPLVMTSGNLSEEPICTDNAEARRRLAPLADAFLLHDREIHTRCDDSVVRMFPATRVEFKGKQSSTLYPLRRGRGFAPGPVRLHHEMFPLLGVGAELKNTFCLTRGRYAFLSHHIGDLKNLETLNAFELGVGHLERLFRIQPEAIAYDLHPNYLTTRYALERAESQNLPMIGVQHHHAHIAACMTENGLSGDPPVIGIAFDGTGYGEDGEIWGGEVLLTDYIRGERAAHLAYIPLPGGDQAVREPWRMALAWLKKAGIAWEEDLPPVKHALRQAEHGIPILQALERQLETRLNSPLTSSMGRLFDAAAALVGVRQSVTYEAQAAIEFEALANGLESSWYPLDRQGEIVDPSPMFIQLVADLRRGVPVPTISAKFHNGIAIMVRDLCVDLRRQHRIKQVVLSGGVWQNAMLMRFTVGLIQESEFDIYIHRQAPTNDGGISLGQVAVAMERLKIGGVGCV